MKKITNIIGSLMVAVILLSCTESGDLYDKDKHSKKDFSAEKTVGALILGAAAVAAVAAGSDNDGFWEGVNEGMFGSSGSAKTSSSDVKTTTNSSAAISTSRRTSRISDNDSGSESCSSSMQCGIGKQCVKEPGRSNGICMQKVDRFGTKSYDLPDMDVGVRGFDEDQCRFNTDCPIGFSCDSKYKVCVKR